MKKVCLSGVAVLLIGFVAPIATLTGCAGKPTVSDFANKPDAELFSNAKYKDEMIRAGGAAKGPTFVLDKVSLVAEIKTLHSYDPFAKGAPRPVRISLRGSNGRVYGPWQAKGVRLTGGGGILFWITKPNVVVEAGSYAVVDSDPSSWSPEPEPSKVGIAVVTGRQ